MKTKLEMTVEVAAMKDDKLKEFIEKLEFNNRTLIEEERYLAVAKEEVVRRFLGVENHYLDQYGVLRKKVEGPKLDSIWF